jgi:hypothetical protein
LRFYSTVVFDDYYSSTDLGDFVSQMIPELDRLVSLPGATGVGLWNSYQVNREQNLLILCRRYYPERLVDRFPAGAGATEPADADLLHAFAQIAQGVDTLGTDSAYSPVVGTAPTISSHNLLLNGRNAFVSDFGLALKRLGRKISDEYGPRIIRLGGPNLGMRGGQFDLASIYYFLRTGVTIFGVTTTESQQEILRRTFASQSEYDKTGRLSLDALLEPREREVVARALAKDHAGRFSNCSQFIAQLVSVRNAS